jgi:hypothetical protein
MGSVLILAGLAPGLFEGLAEHVRNGIQSFGSPIPVTSGISVRQPRWLALPGAVLVTAALLAFLAN